MKRRNLILLLGGASSGAMTVGTGAFSSAQVERRVEVNVVDDEDAFVGYETPRDGATVSDGERITLVEIRNRFGADQEIATVGVGVEAGGEAFTEYWVERKSGTDDGFGEVEQATIVEGSPGAEAIETPGSGFGPGGRERIRAEVGDLDPGSEVTVVVTIIVKGIEGTGVTAQLFGDTRSFTIEGGEDDTAVEPDVPEFAGNGNVFLGPEGVVVDVRALYGKPTGKSDDTRIEPSPDNPPITWDTGEYEEFKNAKPDDEDEFDPSDKLLAVHFVDRDLVYYNPKHHKDDISFPEDWPEPDTGETRGNG